MLYICLFDNMQALKNLLLSFFLLYIKNLCKISQTFD